MNRWMSCLSIIILFGLSGMQTPSRAAEAVIRGLMLERNSPSTTTETVEDTLSQEITALALLRAEGDLEIDRQSFSPVYTAYFQIPISFEGQVPILIEVESDDLVDYRFVSLTPPNVICAARLNRAPSSSLTWRAHVMVRHNRYLDRPHNVPVSELSALPDSVLPWLQATDCCQADDPLIQFTAHQVAGSLTNVEAMASAVNDRCHIIPWEFNHSPWAFDAVYALQYGNSCTGHAHAGAAMLRALGIPARVLLMMPTWAGVMDHHWIIQYYLPTYGWIMMETSSGENPTYPAGMAVTHACHPHDEFPFLYAQGVESRWFTSDLSLGVNNPGWGLAHRSVTVGSTSGSAPELDQARALADSVFSCYVHCYGIGLTDDQQLQLDNALTHQQAAWTSLMGNDLSSFTTSMQMALNCYADLELQPEVTVLVDDFESGEGDWTHGGTHDEWELGVPTLGPTSAHSGENCWGTDLDDNYENSAVCWLQSSSFSLVDFSCAYLSFWTFLWVEDQPQVSIADPLYVQLMLPTGQAIGICGRLCGVNDDPVIPGSGGWNRMVLDLTPWAGEEELRLRFMFESSGVLVQPGAFIDDVRVYGRRLPSSTATAEVLADFVTRQENGTVDLEWRVTPEFRGADFRLSAFQDPHRWEVTCDPIEPDRYRARDGSGRIQVGEPVTYTVLAHLGDSWSQVRQETVTLVDARTRLLDVSPNPFNPSTTVTFVLQQPQHVHLAIHDVQGQLVTVLENRLLEAGKHSARWDGRDSKGQPAASGHYVLRLESASRVEARKLVLVR